MKKKKILRYILKSPWFVVVNYAVFGYLWIKYSDSFLSNLNLDPQRLSELQTIKGTMFILVTSLLLLLLVRKNIKRNIRYENQRVHFMTNTPIPLLVVTDECEIVFLNHSFTELYGFRLDDLENFEVFLSKNIPDSNRIITAKEDSGPSRGLELTLVDKKGEQHDIRYFHIDQKVRSIHLFQDISEEIRLKEELIQKDQSRIVSQMAGGIAHDFKNQLTIIQMALDQIEMEDHCQHLQEKVHMMEEAIRHSTALSRELMTLSKEQKVQLSTIDMIELLKELKTSMNHWLPSNIDLVLKLNDQKILCKADKTLIYNGILNALMNSVDAMPGGGTLILAGEASGGQAEITVKDTGEGIPENKLSHIFEPFYTTKKKTGTGLGLATLKSTIEKHGGTIELQSWLHRGTEMRIYLPLQE